MLKGLALTPPVLGRIAIGRVVEKNGKRLPEKDDEFTITTQVQGQSGWIPHPLDEALRQQASGKLRSIPVRLVFNDPDLNLRANFTLFDRARGRPLCVGNGETCRRVTSSGVQSLPCPGPESCELGESGGCKLCGRLNVRIGDEDEFGTFILRTTGFNSIRTLATRLRYFAAGSGGLLAGLPLELRLRGKSTAQSHWTPIYYVDLTLRKGMGICEAIASAKAFRQERLEAGFDQDALDAAAREGFLNGAFEETMEEGAEVAEEFFPEPLRDARQEAPAAKATLAGKLEGKASKLAAGRAARTHSSSAAELTSVSSEGVNHAH